MHSQIVSLLEKLGLTEYEARTLSSLFNLKEEFAPKISRHAQVPKTRVYDVLDRLVQKRLIIEIYGRPKKYRVIEPSKVFEMLLEEKKSELSVLEKKTVDILDQINEFSLSSSGDRIMKVKDQNDFIKILAQEISSAKESVLGFSRIAKQHYPLKESLKSASKKNVNVRMLDSVCDVEVIKELTEHKVDLKEHDHSLNAYIIDDSKVILGLNDFNKDNSEYHFSIWENNPEMVTILKSHFNNNWKE